MRNGDNAPASSEMRGQALVEFAIIGSLALLALALLIQVGLRANYQQEIEQQNFRRAMQEAQKEDEEESQAVSVYQVRDRQVPNPADGLGIMSRSRTEASSTVTWGEYLTFLDDGRESQPLTVVRLNDQEQRYRAEDLKKVSKTDPSQECTNYYFDCIGGCDPEDDDCRRDCRKTEDNNCDSLPLVRHIHKELVSHGEATQESPGGGVNQIVTGLSTTSTEATTMDLNTKRDPTISSSLTKTTTFDDAMDPNW